MTKLLHQHYRELWERSAKEMRFWKQSVMAPTLRSAAECSTVFMAAGYSTQKPFLDIMPDAKLLMELCLSDSFLTTDVE